MFEIKISLNSRGLHFIVDFNNDYVVDVEGTVTKVVEQIEKMGLYNVMVFRNEDDTIIASMADESIAIGELGILMLDVEAIVKSE